MKSISWTIVGMLLCGFSLEAQTNKKMDSLQVAYEASTDITERVELLRDMFNMQLYMEPGEAKNIALKILDISQKENYANGIALGNYGLGNYHLITNTPDSANYFLKKSAEISLKNNFGNTLANSISGQASIKGDRGDYMGAIKLNDSLLPLYQKLGNYLNYGIALGNTARFYNNMGQYDRAMEGYIAALAVLDTIDEEPFRRADIQRDIGKLNYFQGNYEKSIEYFRQALAIYEETSDNLYQSYVLNDLGNAYVEMEDLDKGLEAYQKSRRISEEFNYLDNTANVLANVGMVYRQKGDLDQALEYQFNALKINRTNNSSDNVVSVLGEIGKTYMEKNDIPTALRYLNESIALADSIKTGYYLLNGLNYRAKAYEKNGQFEKALEDQKKYQALNDSLFNTEKSKQIENLNTYYETEQKEAEIALQQEEINTLNEKAKVDRLTKGLYAGGMFSFIAVSGLLFFGFRQRMKKNRIAREKQEEIYRQEIAHKKKELASQTLHLVQKNTFIQELKENLENIKSSPEKFKTEFRRIVMLLRKENASDKDWEVFKTYFAEVHNDFDQKLKTLYPDISEKEIRLAAFLRMNLTTKEIAATLNVLPDSILKSKYRLKKKLDLDKDTDLITFLNTL
ncbi:tetratricopeptide repeat protein [Flagellimonas olearia]|uniref:MalT-like TPR region domain-containing protein n=1 Tax=Flagellimonas olearia TaxID=552546 RepID=A0A444VPM5_9FLAO|nr:tetratricopeptide repeat protein [Allomuricauda olearia]RYC52731.1 hypothetical protein DN53_00500 [Allomuricauda olearia]